MPTLSLRPNEDRWKYISLLRPANQGGENVVIKVQSYKYVVSEGCNTLPNKERKRFYETVGSFGIYYGFLLKSKGF